MLIIAIFKIIYCMLATSIVYVKVAIVFFKY